MTTVESAAGHVVIVRSEPDGSISLLVGRAGIYVLASLTIDEAAEIRGALTDQIRRYGRAARAARNKEERSSHA